MTYNGLSMNTILPTMDMWQYSMLPLCTAPSVAYPQDSLSSLNDQKLFKFNCYAENMLKQTTLTNQLVDSWAQQFNARLTQWYQDMMNNLAFNTKVTGLPGFPGASVGCGCTCGGTGRAGGSGSAEGVRDKKEEMDDLLVWKYMARLGSVDTYGDKFKEKVTLKDGTKSTYVDRLTQLCKDYVTDNKLGLSASEFEACKDAAEKMKESGKIDKSDYTALKAIVENHLGKAESGEDDDEDGGEGNDDGKISRSSYYTEGHYDVSGTNDAIAQQYLDAFNGSFTGGDKWKAAGKSIAANNVIEVLESFENNNDYGEDWISAVLDDVSDWKGSNTWFMDDDKAWPIVKPVSEALCKRATDIQALSNCDDETKKELANAVKQFEAQIKLLNNKSPNDDMSDDEKLNLANALNNLVSVIKKSEEKLYVERS